MGVVKSSLQTWHCSAASSEDNDSRGVPTQSVGSGTSALKGIVVEGVEVRYDDGTSWWSGSRRRPRNLTAVESEGGGDASGGVEPDFHYGNNPDDRSVQMRRTGRHQRQVQRSWRVFF